MQRFKFLCIPCVLLVIVAVFLLHAGGAAHATAVTNCGTWSVVSSPNVGKNSVLSGVATVSANDVWAVGYSGTKNTQQPLILHWNGTQWGTVPGANPGSPAELSAVSVITTNDVWAVGTANLTSGASTSLFEHWDGSHWSIAPGVDPGSASFISGVTAIATNDVWAVGSYDNTSNQSTSLVLIEHWNGTHWTDVLGANTQQAGNALSSVAAVSATNIWAVGASYGLGTRRLIEHWDGSHWHISKSPNLPKYSNPLNGVAASAANNVWAVGNVNRNTLTEQWNGSNWQVVSSPSPSSIGNTLNAVTANAANNSWAVGYTSKNSSTIVTLIEQWNGSAWSVVTSPNVGSGDNSLLGVAQVSGGNQVWAVGFSGSQNSSKTLIEYYC